MKPAVTVRHNSQGVANTQRKWLESRTKRLYCSDLNRSEGGYIELIMHKMTVPHDRRSKNGIVVGRQEHPQPFLLFRFRDSVEVTTTCKMRD